MPLINATNYGKYFGRKQKGTLRPYQVQPSTGSGGYLNNRDKRLKRWVTQKLNELGDNKFTSQTSALTSFNSAITSAGELYNLLPDLSQGDNDYQRTASRVKVNYLTVEGMIKITNTATAPEPKEVILYMLEDKVQTDASQLSSLGTPNFLNNNGLSQNMDGTFATMSLPVDTERFKVLKKVRVRLTQNYMPASTQSGVIDNGAVLYHHFRIKFNWSKSKSKTMIYRNASDTQPVNRNYFFCLGYVNYSGAVDVALQNATLQLTRLMYFQDLQ